MKASVAFGPFGRRTSFDDDGAFRVPKESLLRSRINSRSVHSSLLKTQIQKLIAVASRTASSYVKSLRFTV